MLSTPEGEGYSAAARYKKQVLPLAPLLFESALGQDDRCEQICFSVRVNGVIRGKFPPTSLWSWLRAPAALTPAPCLNFRSRFLASSVALRSG